MMLNADPSEEELETFFQALPDLPSAPPKRSNTTPGGPGPSPKSEFRAVGQATQRHIQLKET